MNFLGKWKISSTPQIAVMYFKENAHPQKTASKVLKRLNMQGKTLSVIRSIDEPYLHTLKPSAIHHKSNMIPHQLKLIDYYIEVNQPEKCLIEPILGEYEPDLFYRDHMNRSVCVEIQLTKISKKKMQHKIDLFIKEYGKNHDSKILYICTSINYKGLTAKDGFKIIQRNLPNEVRL